MLIPHESKSWRRKRIVVTRLFETVPSSKGRIADYFCSAIKCRIHELRRGRRQHRRKVPQPIHKLQVTPVCKPGSTYPPASTSGNLTLISPYQSVENIGVSNHYQYDAQETNKVRWECETRTVSRYLKKIREDAEDVCTELEKSFF